MPQKQPSTNIAIEVSLLGRDRAQVRFEFAPSASADLLLTPVVAIHIEASGCSDFLRSLESLKNRILALPESDRKLRGSAAFDALLPLGTSHVSILLRELILRARSEFHLPYEDIELCHCRAVPTDVVDRAIVSGCHTVQSVARATSAGTSCGTCKPDTEKLIAYRLKSI